MNAMHMHKKAIIKQLSGVPSRHLLKTKVILVLLGYFLKIQLIALGTYEY